MANIKLVGNSWEAEGIFDKTQNKTQKAINAEIAEVAQNNSDLVILRNTQPTETGNKIWIKEGESYQIPVMADLVSNNITNNSSVSGTNVTGALNTLGSNVSSLQGSLNTIEDDLSDEIDARENAIAAIVSDKTAYTPSFTWYTNTDPTVDNKDFSYSAINDRLLLIYGRFRLVSKNETNTNTSLGLSIPTKYVIDGTSTANFGLVFGMAEITNLVTRLSSSRTSIFFTLGGGGNWSYGAFTEGRYYTVLALIPVKLA